MQTLFILASCAEKLVLYFLHTIQMKMPCWQDYSHCDVSDIVYCWQDIWPKLCKPEQNKALHEALQVQHAESMKHFEQGCAIVQPLMEHLVEAACDDPAAVLLPQLVLPLLRERLEAKFQAHKVLTDCVHNSYVLSESFTYPDSIHMPCFSYREMKPTCSPLHGPSGCYVGRLHVYISCQHLCIPDASSC